jgi:cyclophilin family peptidyl-prolyl cis-trans isomerase
MIAAPARLAALAVVAAVAFAACGGGATDAPVTPSGGPTQAPSAVPASPPVSGIPAGCPTSPPPPMAADETATVTLATEEGDIVVEVKGSLAPNAAGNFVALVECGAYDGVIFHRIIPDFMVQSGDVEFGRTPNVDEAMVGQGGPGYAFADDPVTTPYLRGTVAMANSGPDTNGSQFFICVADVALAPDYTIFGSVLSGMEVADVISTGPSTGGQESRALEPIAITKATVARP